MNKTAVKIILSSELLSIAFLNSLSAKVPVEKTDNRPNILLFVFDDASYQHFSANGSKWTNTPGFDRVAKEGIRFENFYTCNAKSAPSRASMLTGLYSWQLKEAGNHIGFFPPEIKVFPEVLQENGYSIGFTGKPWAPGTAKTNEGKERFLVGKPYLTKTIIPPTTAISHQDYAANFSDFLTDNPSGKPWFFWCGGWEPHRPYQYRSGIDIGGKNTASIDSVPSYLPDNDSVRTDLLDYGFELEYFDQQIAKIIQDLEDKNLLDNTIIVITSDNGMPFPRSKGYSFDESNHIPMAIMWKNGIAKSGNISNYFSVVDLASTFIEVSKIDIKKSGLLPSAGNSFAPVFLDLKKGNSVCSKGVLYFGRERNDFGRPNNEGYPTRSILKDNFLFIANLKNDRYPGGNPETGYLDCDGSPTKSVILNLKRSGKNNWYWDQSFGFHPAEELYNIAVDQDCLHNLAENNEFSHKKAALKRQLFKKLKSQNDPRVTGNGDVFDNYPFMSKDYWNFWERVRDKEIINPASKTEWVNPTDYELIPNH